MQQAPLHNIAQGTKLLILSVNGLVPQHSPTFARARGLQFTDQLSFIRSSMRVKLTSLKVSKILAQLKIGWLIGDNSPTIEKERRTNAL